MEEPELPALARRALARMQALRERFLAEPARGTDYWRDEGDLHLYDLVLGARIGWKWEAALDLFARTGAQVPIGRVVDFGCGTGRAARAFLARHPATELVLVDRSQSAAAFAARTVSLRHPGLPVRVLLPDEAPAPDVLLLSHVLNELDGKEEARIETLAEEAALVFWVESATRAVSRRLSALRDRWVRRRPILLPCPHAGPCGALGPGHEADWCHLFARVPSCVHRSANWASAALALGIDLRALPYSLLVAGSPPGQDRRSGAVRLIGRSQAGGAEARVFVCAEEGLSRLRVVKARTPELHRRLRKDPGAGGLVEIERRGDVVVAARFLDRED